MAWTPRITWIAPDTLTAAVEFTDGTRKIVRHFNTSGTLASLKPQVRGEIVKLDAALTTDLVEGAAVDLTPDPVIPPADPTPQELLQRDFLRKYRKWQQVQAAVLLGVIPSNDPRVTTATTEARDAFRPAFVDLL